MRDRGWIWAQVAVAGMLLVLSIVGILGVLVFDAAELVFSFAGAIQAFAVFPGLVLSLVLNALIMRAHRELGVSLAEKWLLGVEFALVAWLLVLHFWSYSGDALGLAGGHHPGDRDRHSRARAQLIPARRVDRAATAPAGLAGARGQHQRTGFGDRHRVLGVGAA
jgi:hypothetical protein